MDQISSVGLTRGFLGQPQINALKDIFYFGLRPSELLKTKLEGIFFSSVTSLAYGTEKGETSIQAVSSWMGHLDVAMSFKVYRDHDRVLVGRPQ